MRSGIAGGTTGAREERRLSAASSELCRAKTRRLSLVRCAMLLGRAYVARHLRGDIYEVRADAVDSSYRLLFSLEGRKGRIRLALVLFPKRTQRTPSRFIDLAERRLAEWRARGPSL